MAAEVPAAETPAAENPAAGVPAGVVLAAGAGRRYGRPKALVPYGDQLLVDLATETLRTGGCDPVVVVLGAAADQVRSVARLAEAVVVDNPHWRTGMGSSLRAGLSALAGTSAQAAVVLLVDMPGISAEAVRRVAAGAGPSSLVMAGYGEGHGQQRDQQRDQGGGGQGGGGQGGGDQQRGQGGGGQRRGHPVLLGRDHWSGVCELAVGDTGARPYLRRHAADVRLVSCGDVADDRDLDYPDVG